MPMSEAIAAVVFDLDGVLVDSESVWDAARREVVARNGGRWQADATWAMMGMSSPEWSRYLHDQLGVPLKPEQINALVIAALLDQFRRRLPLLPGAVVAVRRLADRWPLGLASSANRPVIDTVLKQAGITDCFAVTVSGEEVAAGKPAPDVYLAATHRLGVDPADAAAVEDSTSGRRGGNGRDRQSQPQVPTRARRTGSGGAGRRVPRRVDAGRDRVRGAASTQAAHLGVTAPR
jgi:HAD superfamily hydrolase (TIGR01509 family)